MQRVEVSGAVRPMYGSLCVKRLNTPQYYSVLYLPVISMKTTKGPIFEGTLIAILHVC